MSNRILVAILLGGWAMLGASSAVDASDLGVVVSKERAGVRVVKVMPKSLAEQMEIRGGDVIYKVNGELSRSLGDLQNALSTRKVRTPIRVDLVRRGKHVAIKGTVFWPQNYSKGSQKSRERDPRKRHPVFVP